MRAQAKIREKTGSGKYNGFICTIFALLFAGVMFLLAGGDVRAEGSRELNSRVPGNESYRAFTEWDNGSYNAGVERVTLLKVVMKKGEKLCLGSSVYDAVDTGNKSANDILVRCQVNGQEYIFDVIKDGAGFIKNREMELAGPNYNGNITTGYTPLIFEAPYTGIYELEFHAKANTRKNIKDNGVLNPDPKKLNMSWERQGASVAAWDATVLNYNNEPVKGRVFANYIALNTGTESVGMYASLHILTTDGYQYNLDTNGIGPYGFILYSNNAGLINGPTGLSLYKNAKLKTQSGQYVAEGGVIVPTPDWVNKLSVVTHRVFFNDPDDEIPAIAGDFPLKPQPMPEVTAFKFVGNMDGNNQQATETGAGGAFKATFTSTCTFDIIIDTDGDGNYDAEKDVALAAAAAKGENSILWDGKDKDGNLLDANDYKAQIRVHGGEFHFPMIDAENCPAGLKVTLMNPPEWLPDDYDKTTIYYDASNYKAYNGTPIKFPDKPNDAPNPIVAVKGVSSRDGAMGFNNTYGNDLIMDMWSYVLGDPSDQKYVRELDIEISEAEPTEKRGAIMGTVFFDSNRNKVKESSERTMEGVELILYDETGTTQIMDKKGNVIKDRTNGRGQFVFSDVPYNDGSGKYMVKPTLNVNGDTHEQTTSQCTISLKSAIGYVDNIGLYTEHDVKVEMSADKSELDAGDSIEFTITVTNTKAFPAANVKVKMPIPTVNDVPAVTGGDPTAYTNGLWTIGTLEKNGSRTLKISMKPITSGDVEESVSFKATVSCDYDNNATNNEAVVSFKVKPSEKYTVVYHPNTGTGTEHTEEKEVTGRPNPLSANTYTKTDHTFLGWSTDPDVPSVKYLDKQPYMGTGGSILHLYAVWQSPSPDVKVTLSADPLTITDGEEVTLSVKIENVKDDPAKNVRVEVLLDNIQGDPVSTGTDGTVAFDSGRKKWTWTVESLAKNEVKTYSFKFVPVFIGTVAKTEHYTAYVSCDYDSDLANNMDTADVTIKPMPKYTITFNPNEGTGTERTETYTVTAAGSKLWKNTFTRDGFDFLGWSTTNTATDKEYSDEDTYIGIDGESKTLYAVWREKPDTDALIAVTPDKPSIEREETVTFTLTVSNKRPLKLSNVRVHLAFAGIVDLPEAEAGITYDPETGFIMIGEMDADGVKEIKVTVKPASSSEKGAEDNRVVCTATVYWGEESAQNTNRASTQAEISVKSFTVIYKANDGSSSEEKRYYSLPASQVILAQSLFTRPDHDFIGWSEDSASETAEYSAGEDLGGKITEESITLYAVWKKRESTGPGYESVYHISYDWGSEFPPEMEIPIDVSRYKTEEEALAALDKLYPAGIRIEGVKGDKKGFWIFSGWAVTAADSSGGIKVTGSWTFEEAGNPESSEEPNEQVEESKPDNIGESDGKSNVSGVRQKTAPNTGDQTETILLWLVCIAASLTGIIKKNEKNF